VTPAAVRMSWPSSPGPMLWHEWQGKCINTIILAEQVARTLGQCVIVSAREGERPRRAQFHGMEAVDSTGTG